MLLISLPQGILEFLLPLYIVALGGSPTLIGTLVGIGAMTRIIALLTSGRLVDRGWGRGVLLTGLLLLGVGWCVWAFVQSIAGLVLGRMILSLAFVCVDVALTWMVAAFAPPEQRGQTFGRLTAAGSQGAIIGVLVAGSLLILRDPQTQRDAINVLRSFAITLNLPAPASRLDAFELVFVVFAGCALGAMLFARQRRPYATQAQHVSLLRQWYNVWRDNAVRQIVVLNLLTSIGYGVSVPMILPLLRDRFQTELIGLGIAYAIPGILYAIAPAILGRLSDTYGYRPIIGVGFMINMGVYATLAFTPNMIWAAGIWTGEALAYSLYVPALNAWIASILPAQRGMIISLSSVVSAVGVSVAAPLGGWLYQHGAYWLPFVMSALTFAFAGWLVSRYAQRSAPAMNHY